MPDFSDLISQAKKMQEKMKETQEALKKIEAEGILSVVIQHEMDHLEGKIFVDYLSNLKREMIRKKLIKQKKISTAN